MYIYTLRLIDNDEESFDDQASSFLEFDVAVTTALDEDIHHVRVDWHADERGIPIPTIRTALKWTHLAAVLEFLDQGLDATGNDFYAELFYMESFEEPATLSFSK